MRYRFNKMENTGASSCYGGNCNMGDCWNKKYRANRLYKMVQRVPFAINKVHSGRNVFS